MAKFASNDPQFNEVFREVTPNASAAEPITDALGIRWNYERNELFNELLLPMRSTITKRELLSIISKPYDPCGALGPALLGGKACLQKACKESPSWDQALSDELQKEIQSWIRQTNGIFTVTMPLAISPFSRDATREVHFFSDACEIGFSSVSHAFQSEQNDVRQIHSSKNSHKSVQASEYHASGTASRSPFRTSISHGEQMSRLEECDCVFLDRQYNRAEVPTK